MPRFFIASGAHNLTPPATPVQVRSVTVEQAVRPRLDPSALEPLAGVLGDLYMEAMTAAITFRDMAVPCIFHSQTEGDNPAQAQEQVRTEFQKLAMAIELVTERAVTLGGTIGAIAPLARGVIISSPRGPYRGGPASIDLAQVQILTEIMDTLDTKPTKRIETAMLEYDTALKSGDVRRQFIHAAVALEAVFGDDATEALSYKVPLRAACLIPSLKDTKQEGFEFLREAYTLRSKFVHGTWDQKTLVRAEATVDRLIALTAEAVLEFLFRIKDSRPSDFPALDVEAFLS